jgi:ParB family chromosome partitioning protein
MSKSRGGLGRGLAALIPTGPATNTVSEILMGGAIRPVTDHPVPASGSDPGAGSTAAAEPDGGPGGRVRDGVAGSPEPGTDLGPRYAEIPVGAIRPNPRNPRTVFDQDALDELAHSIREFGLLQPVVVRPVDAGYELVMGERRWRAAQQAGVPTVSAIVRRTEDADLLRDALLENIHRTNLNPLEEAAAYQQLLEEFEVTQDELASRLGRSRPVISNTIRLLNLPVVVQRRVAAGVLSAGHARALLSLSDPGDQEELATRIVAEGLSVRGTEEAVTLLARQKPAVRRSQPRKMIMPGVQELAANLSDAFDTRVLVELGRRKGKIVVEFATVDDLERLIAIMAPSVSRRNRRSGPVPGEVTARPAGPAPVSGSATGPADLYEVTAGGFVAPVTQPAGPTGSDGGLPGAAPAEAAVAAPAGGPADPSPSSAGDPAATVGDASEAPGGQDPPDGADRGSVDRGSTVP